MRGIAERSIGGRKIFRLEEGAFARRCPDHLKCAEDSFQSPNRPVPDDIGERIQRLDRLIAAFDTNAQVAAHSEFLASSLGSLWQAERTDYALAARGMSWLQSTKEKESWIPDYALSDTRISAT